jgi:protocatechuate 3,4-dioxygenase alpha subunit
MVPTPSQTVGPFFGFALPFEEGAVCATDGRRIEGQVLDGAGEPVADALIEVAGDGQFGRCPTDAEGAFHFLAREPDSGFLSLTVFARGLLRHVTTRIYFPGHEGDVPREVDPARRQTLIARRDGDVLHFDVRLQGPGETVFFE